MRKLLLITGLFLGLCSDRVCGEVEILEKELNSFPLCFIDGQSLSENTQWRVPSIRTGVAGFADKAYFEEYRFIERAFATSSGCSMVSAQDFGSSNELVKPPFALVTTFQSKAGNFAGGLSNVGSSEIGDGLDLTSPDRNLPNFRLLDLFGCCVNDRLYQFLESIEMNGCLVLPFTGVDFSHVEDMPNNITKLVVYNSYIDDKALRFVLEMPHLKELVLWGCWAPAGQPDLIGPVSGRLSALSLINCSKAIKDSFLQVEWPNLRFIGYSGDVAWLVRKNLPMLEQVNVYLTDGSRSKQSDRRRVNSVARRLFGPRKGKMIHYSVRQQSAGFVDKIDVR